ncbi:MAG: carboxypeptidase regulatory-like domain-containing protein [Bryobacteraceae bacterium]
MLYRSVPYGLTPVLASLMLVAASPRVRAQETSTEAREHATEKADQKAEEKKEQHERAEEQLKQQEHQRVLGIVPAFNSSNTLNAAPLNARQKFRLAFRGATDPFAFAFAAVDAGINQAQDDYHGYGQGIAGYSKRFGASYTDSFNGTMLGNALLPVLFHQDPRYFRKGTGSVKGRIWYAVISTVRCKGDNGGWQPSYSNLLGNFAAGTISNIYYPPDDRGVELTVQRALTVSAEGAIGAMFFEFWPDIARKFARRHASKP